MQSKNVSFQVRQLKTVQAYILDLIHSREKQLMGSEVRQIRSHFSVMAMDMDKVKQYLLDPSNETHLNVLKNWIDSSASWATLTHKIKAILLLSFLSS